MNTRLPQVAMLLSTALLAATPTLAQTASSYQIRSVSPAVIPAGAAGATLALTGTLPDFSQGAYQACFFTGAGSFTPLTPTTIAGVTAITIPAANIQAIDPSSFNAANAFAISARLAIVPSGTTCDGTYNASLTNSLSVPIVEPLLGTYAGPTTIPQTNSRTNLQAPPASIILSGTNFAANTTVTFGAYAGVASRVLTPNSIAVAVPSSFSAADVGTTATLKVCNTGGSATFCSTPATPITLTVVALYPSMGALTASPSPATTADQITVSAQFSRSTPGSPLPEPGVPSGTVSFTADSATIPPAPLVLDTSAVFVQQTSTISTPTTAAPAISPAAGTYLNSVTISLTDATPGSVIYYTQDGSTPTTASTAYTAPFAITATSTIQAIAAASGLLNSAVASAAYTITVTPPAKLAFVVQPTNTAINTAIAPPLQVAIQDANGNTVTSSTLPVSIALARNPTHATLSGTTTVNALNGIATFTDVSLNNVSTGNTFLASSGSLASTNSSPFDITSYPLTMAVQSALVGINSTLGGTVTLGHAAPQGGLAVTLTSDTPANVTIAPATLTIAANQTTGSFTYKGVAAGNATLSATATNYQTGTVQVTGTAAQVSLGTIPAVAPGQSVSLALSLPTAAPPGGTTVSFTSSDTGVATVTSSIMVPAGQRTATTNPQITGITIGTTTIVASAPGYAPDSRAVNVTVVATFNPTSTSIALGAYNNTTLNISAPAQSGGITFTLKSDDPTIATVPASITIPQGATSIPIPITGVADGTTSIRADATGVTEATLPLTVNSKIQVGTITTGVHLENYSYYTVYVPSAPSGPSDVTLTISDPTIATISTSAGTVGTATLTVHNITTQGYLGTIYLQGQRAGTTTLTVSANGYTTGTATMTVYPSGFELNNGDFSTTSFSTPTTLTIYPVILTPGTLTIYSSATINPGYGPVSVPVTSSNTSIGTIKTNPAVLNGGDTYVYTYFQPVTSGTTTVQLGSAPAGFSTPSQLQSLTATVTAPALTASALTTGVNLQNTSSYLAQVPVAPPSQVIVTVTVSNPAIVTLSKTTTAVGVATLTFPITTAGYLPQFYIQGQSVGTATMTVSAPGYTSATSTLTVAPSGFTMTDYGTALSTTTFSRANPINVYPSVLNMTGLSYAANLSLNPGIPSVSVLITSSNTATGTITTSPVVFNGGDSVQSTSFQPAAAGTTTIAIARTPAGYTTPSNYQQIATTVTAPALSASNLTTGVNLQNSTYSLAYVPVSPPSPETVTITISNPAVATLSKSTATVGVTTLTFPATAGYPPFFIQGQRVGTATMTVSAPGYTSATSTITVQPSGFTFAGTGTISTTTFSSPVNINVYPSLLNSTDLSYSTALTLNPGIPSASVPITSSNTSTGTITTSPVVFNGGDSSKSTSFQPTAAGTSTVSIAGTPTGYSTPANYQQIATTVTAPQITVGASTTGVNMQVYGGYTFIYLPAAPPNPVTVTVTSNGPAIATISSSATAVGTNTITFSGITSAGYLPAIYIQGQSLGTTTLTASAPGYTNGNGSVTVNPSGFAFAYSGSFSTTATASPTTLTVYPFVLNNGLLTVQGAAALNPGSTSVSVPVTSSNPLTGIITTSPLVFNGGDSSNSTTFQPVATGTSTLTVQPPLGFSTPSQYQQITATVQ